MAAVLRQLCSGQLGNTACIAMSLVGTNYFLVMLQLYKIRLMHKSKIELVYLDSSKISSLAKISIIKNRLQKKTRPAC